MLKKMRRVVHKPLAGLLKFGRKTMKGSLDSRNHQEGGSEKHDFMQRVVHYLPIGVQGPKAKELGWTSERELKAFSEALYFPPSRHVAACRSSPMQYSKAEKLTEEADWAAASHIGQSLKTAVSAAPSEKQKAVQPLESNEQQLLELSSEQSKGNSSGMNRSSAAERPAAALKPAARTQASFPAARSEDKAGKKNKRQAKLAQAKASAAEPPAEVMAGRTASKANVGRLSARLFSLSASKCHICARNATFAWIGQHHQHQPNRTTAFTNLIVVHFDDASQTSVSKSHIEDKLRALNGFAPNIQRFLNTSWRVHTAWSRHGLPTGCFPTIQIVENARSDLALHWHGLDQRETALTLESKKRKLLGFADGLRKDKS